MTPFPPDTIRSAEGRGITVTAMPAQNIMDSSYSQSFIVR